jgi:phosphoglycerate-specific signal transduction histidine kinase
MNLFISVLFAMWVITLIVAAAAVRTIWLRELGAAARNAEQHHREIEHLHQFYEKALEAIGHTMSYGQPTLQPAVVTEQPDAETHLRRTISEQTIQRGMADLKSGYEAAGLNNIPEERLRDEVLQLMSGISPDVT